MIVVHHIIYITSWWLSLFNNLHMMLKQVVWHLSYYHFISKHVLHLLNISLHCLKWFKIIYHTNSFFKKNAVTTPHKKDPYYLLFLTVYQIDFMDLINTSLVSHVDSLFWSSAKFFSIGCSPNKNMCYFPSHTPCFLISTVFNRWFRRKKSTSLLPFTNTKGKTFFPWMVL